MYSSYPVWKNNSYSKWSATGVYTTYQHVEHFEEEQPQTIEETYQDFMYSIAVYFYRKVDDKREFKVVKNIQMKKIKTDKIPELDYSNTTSDDIKSEFTITVVDLTSYIPKQPMLNLKYIVNNGEIINKIGFMYPNPSDPIMREYTFDVRPFKTISFTFDIDVMNNKKDL